ncbi:secreted Ly-6/uPAR domain-containing protein 2 isoform X2 [Suricata suricatta]|uniref:secreted Ly-6/uPAR domain-containing protein 2 isoform X2 n=1 Tax=Suricata suricatta TaxID=37032 RepID=UPI001155C466|nr:secreted Ly-6/uPAR domain-containing protein 2 isoform X2 [Suricata suricatta]
MAAGGPGHSLSRDIMRLLLGLLLAAALSLELAQALMCHQCKGYGGCAHPLRCPRSSNYCVTIATRIPLSLIDEPMVTKSCQSGCPEVSSLGLGPHVSIACCQFSLCNQD